MSVAVQTGEGTVEIIFNPSSVPAGARTLGGYIARPALAGQWPTVILFGDEAVPASPLRFLCMVFARHGFVAFAPDFSEDDLSNLWVSRAVANFLANPSGEYSNAQHGYGLIAFGAGAPNLVDLVAADPRADAFVIIGAGLDATMADKLAAADVPGIVIISREDEGTDVETTLSFRETLPKVTFVVYPTGERDFWDDAAEGYDEERADDAMTRALDFFAAQLPARI